MSHCGCCGQFTRPRPGLDDAAAAERAYRADRWQGHLCPTPTDYQAQARTRARRRLHVPETAAEAGRRVLAELATRAVARKAAALVAGGTHRWEWDPNADGVVGLVPVGQPPRAADEAGRAVAVVWIIEDPEAGRYRDFDLDGSVFP